MTRSPLHRRDPRRAPLHRRWVLYAEAARQVDRDDGDSDG
jgi:hypothetical protein